MPCKALACLTDLLPQEEVRELLLSGLAGETSMGAAECGCIGTPEMGFLWASCPSVYPRAQLEHSWVLAQVGSRTCVWSIQPLLWKLAHSLRDKFALILGHTVPMGCFSPAALVVPGIPK